MAETVKVHSHTKKLARLMRFKPVDLEANRRGMMSTWQKKQLRYRRNGYLMLLVLFIVVFGIATMLGFIGVTNPQFIEATGATVTVDEGAIVVPACMGIMVVVMIFGAIYMYNRFSKDITSGVVLSVTSRITCTMKVPEEDDMDNYIRVHNGKYWAVDRSLYQTISPKYTYTVYYSKVTEELLAIEVADSSVANFLPS